jgi:hypothetical protein
MGEPPDQLSPEQEAEPPVELQRKSEKETPRGRVVWKGSVPDKDPMYNRGWTFLGGKNLNPKSSINASGGAR